jgi:hypothetical protein
MMWAAPHPTGRFLPTRVQKVVRPGMNRTCLAVRFSTKPQQQRHPAPISLPSCWRIATSVAKVAPFGAADAPNDKSPLSPTAFA